MVASVSNATKQLDSMFANVVNQTIAAEKQMRLVKLQAQRDALDVKNAVYTDLQNYIQNLQTSTQKMVSGHDSYALGVSQKATVSNAPDGINFLSATTTDEATAAEYEIEVLNLAQNHRVSSDRQTSTNYAVGASGTFTINDVDITVDSADSLMTIAGKINEASFKEGKVVVASVIDNRLVLTAAGSGAENEMTLSGDPLKTLGIIDSEGLVKNELAAAEDASFVVNGISVTRSSNTGIDDVMVGVTLNLADDAEGSKAKLIVGTDIENIKSTINNFLNRYNELAKYLKTKTDLVKIDEGKYERGSLSDDYTVRNMMSELADALASSISSDSSIKSLYELGIEVGDNLTFTLKDSTKFENALANNRADVMTFLDDKMTALDNVLNRYLGTESVMSYSLDSLKIQKENVNNSIAAEETRLSSREALLIEQYSQMQAMMDELLNTQQTMNALLYGTTTSSSSLYST